MSAFGRKLTVIGVAIGSIFPNASRVSFLGTRSNPVAAATEIVSELEQAGIDAAPIVNKAAPVVSKAAVATASTGAVILGAGATFIERDSAGIGRLLADGIGAAGHDPAPAVKVVENVLVDSKVPGVTAKPFTVDPVEKPPLDLPETGPVKVVGAVPVNDPTADRAVIKAGFRIVPSSPGTVVDAYASLILRQQSDLLALTVANDVAQESVASQMVIKNALNQTVNARNGLAGNFHYELDGSIVKIHYLGKQGVITAEFDAVQAVRTTLALRGQPEASPRGQPSSSHG